MEESINFNLWSEPWIMVETVQGGIETVGIEQLLHNANRYRALYEPSPLAVVGIHRLLVAILQDIFQPQYEPDLLDLWEREGFPDEKLVEFGRQYAHRFDLFSVETPFLQSADIPLHPPKKGQGKSVGYLLQEQTAGTAVTHYNHTYDEAQTLCAACLAKGLLIMPAFASSGGAGIKPSINGVPPIYIIPGGEIYYQSLLASLVTPNYQPDIADRKNDTPWWRHSPVVGKKKEVLEVGYLHSLTFPARRVRLHPEKMTSPCSRCGGETRWGAAEMVYEMGESRPKEATFWQDPFAAYYSKGGNEPIPLRPVEGRAVWREFAGLFLPATQEDDARRFYRPMVIGQLETDDLRDVLPYDDSTPIPFQTIGLRTDMKMKIFEWESNGFLVPPKALSDPNIKRKITGGIGFAASCDSIIKKTFQKYFGEGKSDRHKSLWLRMSQNYWEGLAPHFQEFVLALGGTADLDTPFHEWLDTVQTAAIEKFTTFAELVGNDAATLRERVQAVSHNRARIYKVRNDNYPKEVNG